MRVFCFHIFFLSPSIYGVRFIDLTAAPPSAFTVPFPDCGVSLRNLLAAGAALQMVVDHAARLQVRINCDRSEITEAAPLELPADPVGQLVFRGDPALLMAGVEDALPAGEVPEEPAERSEFRADLLKVSGVLDDRLHLAAGTGSSRRTPESVRRPPPRRPRFCHSRTRRSTPGKSPAFEASCSS